MKHRQFVSLTGEGKSVDELMVVFCYCIGDLYDYCRVFDWRTKADGVVSSLTKYLKNC